MSIGRGDGPDADLAQARMQDLGPVAGDDPGPVPVGVAVSVAWGASGLWRPAQRPRGIKDRLGAGVLDRGIHMQDKTLIGGADAGHLRWQRQGADQTAGRAGIIGRSAVIAAEIGQRCPGGGKDRHGLIPARGRLVHEAKARQRDGKDHHQSDPDMAQTQGKHHAPDVA